MWKTTLCCNIVILCLLWAISLVVIQPAYNFFVQYSEVKQALPTLTDFAIRYRTVSIVIPILWLIFTVILAKKMMEQSIEKRCELLSFHTSISLCMGLFLIFLFSFAGILPLLKISSALGWQDTLSMEHGRNSIKKYWQISWKFRSLHGGCAVENEVPSKSVF